MFQKRSLLNRRQNWDCSHAGYANPRLYQISFLFQRKAKDKAPRYNVKAKQRQETDAGIRPGSLMVFVISINPVNLMLSAELFICNLPGRNLKRSACKHKPFTKSRLLRGGADKLICCMHFHELVSKRKIYFERATPALLRRNGGATIIELNTVINISQSNSF